MAETNKNKNNEDDVLNLDQKVTVRSIAAWNTYFMRKADGYGEVNIVPNGTARLSRNEIISQVQDGNILFSGTDGAGSHATLYIEDEATRKELGFDSEDGKRTQNILNEKKLKTLFDIKSQSDFERKFKEEIVTRAEKQAIFPIIKKLKLNDYSKIRFIEENTGIKLD